MDSFITVFMSILFEALPFVMIGSIASALIEIYVTPEWLASKIKGPVVLQYMVVGLLGIVFPLCECVIIPVIRRLLKKKMPLGLAITFMLAVPILNPVVLFSTYYAFSDINMMIARGFVGYMAAITIGIILSYISRDKNVELEMSTHSCSCGHEHHEHNEHYCNHEHHEHSEQHNHSHKHDENTYGMNKSLKIVNSFKAIMSHTGEELLSVGSLLILGAFISAFIQIYVPRAIMLELAKNDLFSAVFMMLLAFVLSLCSEADAFIAATFRNQLSNTSILAFLVFGPMLDIKNILMLNSTFKPNFILKLSATIFVITLAFSFIYARLVWGII